jgi:hypothetical protein
MDPHAVPWFLEPTIEQIGAIRVAHAGIDDSIRQVIEKLPAVQWPDHIAPAGAYGLAWTTASIDLAVAHTGKREFLLMTPKREMTVKKRHLVGEIVRQWNEYLAEIPRAVDALEHARTIIASHGIQQDYDAPEIVRAIWMIEEQAVILWDYILFERVAEIAADKQGGLLRIRIEERGGWEPEILGPHACAAFLDDAIEWENTAGPEDWGEYSPTSGFAFRDAHRRARRQNSHTEVSLPQTAYGPAHILPRSFADIDDAI